MSPAVLPEAQREPRAPKACGSVTEIRCVHTASLCVENVPLNFVDDAHLALTCHTIAVSVEKEEICPLSLVLDEGLVLPGTLKP